MSSDPEGMPGGSPGVLGEDGEPNTSGANWPLSLRSADALPIVGGHATSSNIFHITLCRQQYAPDSAAEARRERYIFGIVSSEVL
jgi:hypothetical protein